MSLEDPVGAASIARTQLAADERLLWAAAGKGAYYYDIEKLDPLGEKKKGLLSRSLRAAGNVAGDFAFEAVLGGSDSGPDKPPPADVLVFGEHKAGIAHETVVAHGEPGKRLSWIWALTAHRLLILGLPPEREPEGFARSLFTFGKDVAKILTDTKRNYGEHVEGKSVVIPERKIIAEVPQSRIASVAPAQRRRKPCLRLSFVDGSGIDFLFQVDDPAVFERMVR
ncbi:hypothetical protein [Amycolatopsis pithecellobii]|uniref:Uncharacterized protein n=1 Tax=Amycolatopsis pithecellobii TaxID=664692 RepID=A0A6N7Z5V5_9PSEU|nr:hypothetical protein [Amycolatopsis pithecellobii]MTD57783.1 hypothetical protein [Amycolatopsis pithecellobii]